ncbi:MAG: methylenetetrahydrofolate reductase [NAD(P)H] [Gammaproteobacteria bacterium]|jgi:methylenetetrahydrofolate reductase (NADPH)|nr:methylenetetrahydrofolate reductase [NAD(P)H] [Gammaproteobacteria bacterium]MBT3987310.1 methylenetetrahydrofolate reductase [NAD(P)H] [Gammaproteobacteria bacterium]MBT4256521.1 methylenetetrahydrofolate reductase [NAD(P)H] [Gammaproteobacteria bacterium]MBT4581274.1 methylenetetrahydrofolate reductase [NAD(P)H] [Gammaproteobacteria bacterium]MBT4659812.1 methylenetetrahydrofolate reductase [NAD(P)H] [Gammaproteobacteria bacterium]
METPTQKFSIEFFPPRTEVGEAKLDKVHEDLAKLNPDFFSVTYGAGGSTRDGTRQIVLRYHEAGSTLAPHLSFGGSGEDDIRQLLAEYKSAGIKSLVALRGDIPSGMGSAVQHRYANELVEFIRKETGDHFHIDVACYPEIHPESSSYASDVEFFKRKVDAGANSAITQYFYNADAYYRFVDYCQDAGITIPIYPGIMPITNYANLARFSTNCGAEIPRWLAKRLDGFGDDIEGLRRFGIDVASELCEELLLGGAPGLHFYSMNLSNSVTQIWNDLSLSERQ